MYSLQERFEGGGSHFCYDFSCNSVQLHDHGCQCKGISQNLFNSFYLMKFKKKSPNVFVRLKHFI